jgi:hypothetical protein
MPAIISYISPFSSGANFLGANKNGPIFDNENGTGRCARVCVWIGPMRPADTGEREKEGHSISPLPRNFFKFLYFSGLGGFLNIWAHLTTRFFEGWASFSPFDKLRAGLSANSQPDRYVYPTSGRCWRWRPSFLIQAFEFRERHPAMAGSESRPQLLPNVIMKGGSQCVKEKQFPFPKH